MGKEKFKTLDAKDIKIWQILFYFCKKLKPYKWMFFLGTIFTILSMICDVYEPLYTSKIVDIVQMEGLTLQDAVYMLFNVLLIVALLGFGKIIFNRLSRVILGSIEYDGMRDIKCESSENLQKHSYRFFSNNFSGSLVRKVDKLSSSFEGVVDISIDQILPLLISLPLMMVIIMKESVTIGIVFLVSGVIFSLLNIWFTNNNLKYEQATNEKDSQLTGELSDIVANAFNVIIFGSQERESKFFRKSAGELATLEKKKWKRMTLFFGSMNVFTLFFRILSLGICIRSRGQGYISASVIIMVQLYVARFTSLLYNVEGIFKHLNEVLGESAEMLAILKTPHEIQDKTNKKLKIKEGKIEFQNVDFGYLTDDPIIEDLNMIIKPGEKVAIVGESGSGKTTTIKLLFRLFDLRNGKILIDGQDISQVTQDSLRSQLSMVPQDALLFHRSVRDNIAYGKPDATEKEIIAAAKMARCHDFILNLPEGYDSLVGERGIKLSGGERQRIAIARAILENCKILVLDEATSSLDSESESLIQAAMDEVMKNKTAIVIAHRLSTIMKMDRIIVMDEGVIVEEGTHEELIKKKGGVYHKLWSIQSGGFITPDEGDKINFQPKEGEEKDDL